MIRRYILFANLIPLAIFLVLTLLFVPAGEQVFLLFTALVAAFGWGLAIAVFSGAFTIPVMVRRLFDREGAKSDFGRKTYIDPAEIDGPSDRWHAGKD